MATSDTLAVTVNNKAFPLIERACQTAEFLDQAASRANFPFPEAPLVKSIIHQLAETLVETNEALAACQAQAAGRIGMLTAALQEAVEVIKDWHNMDGAADVWDIYYRNAPEMKRVREALAASRPSPQKTDADVFSEALNRISGGRNGR